MFTLVFHELIDGSESVKKADAVIREKTAGYLHLMYNKPLISDGAKWTLEAIPRRRI